MDPNWPMHMQLAGWITVIPYCDVVPLKQFSPLVVCPISHICCMTLTAFQPRVPLIFESADLGCASLNLLLYCQDLLEGGRVSSAGIPLFTVSYWLFNLITL